MLAGLGNGLLFAWWAGSSFAWGTSLPGFELLLLPGAAAVVVAFVAAPLLGPARTRAVASAVLIASLLYAVTTPVALWAGAAVRMWGFERFVERSKPLVAAIRKYESAAGHPPQSLSDLVPDYLPEVPGTGVGSAPEYHYVAGDQARHAYHGNPWILRLPVSVGILNWDLLLYYPLQNYPAHGHGGVIRRIGDWAYVHE